MKMLRKYHRPAKLCDSRNMRLTGRNNGIGWPRRLKTHKHDSLSDTELRQREHVNSWTDWQEATRNKTVSVRQHRPRHSGPVTVKVPPSPTFSLYSLGTCEASWFDSISNRTSDSRFDSYWWSNSKFSNRPRCQSSFVKKRLVVVKFAFKVNFGSKISVQQHCLTRFMSELK